MPKIALFDIDGTLIKQQSQKLFLKFLFKEGVIGFLFFIKIYTWFFLYKINLVEKPEVVMEKAVLFLKNKPTEFAQEKVDIFFKTSLLHFFDNKIVEVLQEKRQAGYTIVLVSNAFDFLVSRIASFLKADSFLATQLEIKNNIFTGKIDTVMYGKNKVFYINKYLISKKISLLNSFAYTDHHSDLPMLELVDNPVLVNPDKALANIGKQRGWKIIKT